MKFKVICLFFLFSPIVAQSQDLSIYPYYQTEMSQKEEYGFVKLTDWYPWSEHPDSVVISDDYIGWIKIENRNYHILDSEYRTRFLKRIDLKESDHIFIFNFSLDSVMTSQIRDLPLAAYVSIYTSKDDIPLSQDDYVAGLVIDSAKFSIPESNDSPTLVHAGSENPFQTGNISPLVWEKADREIFPSITDSVNRHDWFEGLKPGDVYHDSDNGADIFLQNLGGGERPRARHLVVKSSNDIIFSHVYYDSESLYLIPLEGRNGEPHQWTGQIFKNKPPIIYGFTGNSFACPRIFFIDQSVSPVRIKCDNRH